MSSENPTYTRVVYGTGAVQLSSGVVLPLRLSGDSPELQNLSPEERDDYKLSNESNERWLRGWKSEQ